MNTNQNQPTHKDPFELKSDRAGSYYIELNGQVQPFGAYFFNKRSDLKRLVQRAVKTLNREYWKANNRAVIEVAPTTPGERRYALVVWEFRELDYGRVNITTDYNPDTLEPRVNYFKGVRIVNPKYTEPNKEVTQ